MTIEVTQDSLPPEVMEALSFGIRMDHAYSKVANGSNGRSKAKDSHADEKNENTQGGGANAVVVKITKQRRSVSNDAEKPIIEKKRNRTVKRKENLDHSYQQQQPKQKVAKISGKKGEAAVKSASKAVVKSKGVGQSRLQSRKSTVLVNKPKTLRDKNVKRPADQKTSLQSPKKSVGRPRKQKKAKTERLSSRKRTASHANIKKTVRTYTNKGVPSANILPTNILQDRMRRRTVHVSSNKKK